MTKSREDKDRFIELRAAGMPIAQVARELEIARNTAMTWQKEFEEEIAVAKAIRMEELIDKYRMSKEMRIDFLASGCWPLRRNWPQEISKISLLRSYSRC